MSYSEFTLQDIETTLQLQMEEADLFSHTAPAQLREAFVELLEENIPLGLSINTEKARSELLIAPVLVELRRMVEHKISVFSGIEFNVDSQLGLNGICDFIIAKSAKQFLLTAPVILVVEAKNENIKSGLAQCIATMYAAALFNQAQGRTMATLYGVVTTGSAWKFLRLQQTLITVDFTEYFIGNVDRIMGILRTMVS